MEDVSGVRQLGEESVGNEDRDRLSELPEPLILVILSLLPMVDVVRTSVLSKKWKDMWTTIPVLDFGVLNYANIERDCTNNCSNVFINRVLKLWKGTKIIKFHIRLNCKCSANYIESWLDFAMDHGVEELNCSYSYPLPYFCAPQRLFSYSTIRKLSLSFCDVMITENVHWNRLKCLSIVVWCLEDNVIDKILSGAPQLEVLKLEVWDKYDNLIIHSSSLKRLMINLDVYFEEEANTWLRIWAPNLQTLQISGAPCHRYLVMNLSSLKELTLDIRNYNNDDFPREVVGEMVRQFFPTILCSEKVTLSYLCIKALGAIERKYLLFLSSHFKFVRVRGGGMADLDKISSELKTIVIQHKSSYPKEQLQQVMIEDFAFEIRISCSLGDEKLMFLLMELLLEYADFVDEIVFLENPVIHQKASENEKKKS